MSALTHQESVQAVILNPHEGRARIKKEKAREMPIHNQDSQPPNTPLKRDKAVPWNQTFGIPTLPTIPQLQPLRGAIQDIRLGWQKFRLDLAHHPTHVNLELGCTRSIGSRKAIGRFQKYVLYCGITTEFWPCNKSFVFAISEVGTCFESCIINFPTTPPCSIRADVLETGDVPILFSLPEMKTLGMTLELDPKGAKMTCPYFHLFSSPIKYSTMGHIVLDLTSLAYKPKSQEHPVVRRNM